MRTDAKVDANQPAIVAALRKVGATVQSLAQLGDGVPDLLVGWAGDLWLLEVKDPQQPKNKQQLKPMQVEWHRRWQGKPVAIVLSPEEALRAIGAIA